jgi:hypothetical protein
MTTGCESRFTSITVYGRRELEHFHPASFHRHLPTLSLWKDLKALGHAVVKVEHARFVGRAEPQRVSERPVGDKIFAAVPNSVNSINFWFVEIQHQHRSRSDGRLGGRKVPETLAGQNPPHLIGKLLEGLLGIVGKPEDDQEVGAVLTRRKANHFSGAVRGYGRERIPTLGDVRREVPFRTLVSLHVGGVHI